MLSSDRIDAYINSICEQIRWKRAHTRISKEMRDHLEDGRDAYIAQGLDEAAATEQAITDTGDVMEIGTQFDRIHRPKPQWAMLAAIDCFVGFGLLVGWAVFDSDIYARAPWILLGYVLMWAVYFADFTLLGKRPLLIYCAILMLVVMRAVFFPMHIPSASVLPLIFPIAFAVLIFWARNKGYAGIVLCGLGFGILCVTALMSSVTGFIHFVMIGVILLITAVLRNWFGVPKLLGSLMVVIPFVICTAVAFIYTQGFRSVRLAAIFNPYTDPLGFGFAATQARRILSGAAMLGEGVVDDAWLQQASSDFMLTSLISLWGWTAFAAIISVIILFIIIGFMKCFKQRSGLGFLVSFAVMLTFAVQAVMYIVYNLGFLLAQISLPLISLGNSAMIINLGLMGLMLSVFRSGHVAADDSAVRNSNVLLKIDKIWRIINE